MRLIPYSLLFVLFFSSLCYALEPKPHHALRVTTYNLFWKNGTCPPHKKNLTMEVIKKINADIILLQETTKSWERCINRNLKKLYPYRQYKHSTDADGIAVLSKIPYTHVKYINRSFLRHPAWLINAKTKFGPIEILNLHLPPSVNDEHKIGIMGKHLFKGPSARRDEMAYLSKYISIHKPTILAGDFNEGGYGGAVQRLKYAGWQDPMSLNHVNTHTWVHKIGPFSIKQQFDRILLSPHFRVLNLQVLHEGESDHFPVIIDIIGV